MFTYCEGGDKNKSKGFTLIELVMVIVILGILAAIALPTFHNLQDKAKAASVRGGLGGLRSGISIWYAKEIANNVSPTAAWPSYDELIETSTGVMLQGAIPENPYIATIDSARKIRVGTNSSTNLIDTTVGWIYDDSTGGIWATSPNGEASGY